jgi:hypothetical protein
LSSIQSFLIGGSLQGMRSIRNGRARDALEKKHPIQVKQSFDVGRNVVDNLARARQQSDEERALFDCQENHEGSLVQVWRFCFVSLIRCSHRETVSCVI